MANPLLSSSSLEWLLVFCKTATMAVLQNLMEEEAEVVDEPSEKGKKPTNPPQEEMESEKESLRQRQLHSTCLLPDTISIWRQYYLNQ